LTAFVVMNNFPSLQEDWSISGGLIARNMEWLCTRDGSDPLGDMTHLVIEHVRQELVISLVVVYLKTYNTVL
jgi:hypothetical protein